MSSSSSSSKNKTKNIDRRIAASDQAVVVGEGSTFRALDGGAINEAGRTSRAALETSRQSTAQALDTNRQVSNEALDTNRQISSEALNTTENVSLVAIEGAQKNTRTALQNQSQNLDKAFEFANKAQTDSEESITRDLFKFGTIGALGTAAIIAIGGQNG